MDYLKGTLQACKAYNDLVFQSEYSHIIGNTRWAHTIERDGDFYIRKHPDYPATDGLIEALLPEPEGIDEI